MTTSISRKEIVFILRKKSQVTKNPTVANLLDLEANRIDRMTDIEFEKYARDFVGKTSTTVIKRKV